MTGGNSVGTTREHSSPLEKWVGIEVRRVVEPHEVVKAPEIEHSFGICFVLVHQLAWFYPKTLE